jgi:(p)ppGpp synthase/HD superfamily hydrolase
MTPTKPRPSAVAVEPVKRFEPYLPTKEELKENAKKGISREGTRNVAFWKYQKSLSKEFIATRAYLTGAHYFTALNAMEFASKIHVNKRRDGSPEFSHQMAIAHYLRTLDLKQSGRKYDDVDMILAVSFLHDTMEDYKNVARKDIVAVVGESVVQMVEVLDKTGLSEEEYVNRIVDFDSFGMGPLPALAKGADRIHNLSTAAGAFTKEKLVKYIEETRTYILPMLKEVQRKYPLQHSAFENERLVIKMLCDTLEKLS